MLVAGYIAWALLTDFAGTLFLACTSVTGWRLWRTAMPGQRGPVFNRPPPKPHQQDREQDSPAPAVAPILRNSRSLDRALAELEGMVGLASVKAEIRKLIDVLAAERERARLGHRAEPQALHRVP